MTNPTPPGQVPEALPAIQRFEVVDCIDSKHVPAVIPNASGPWVRYEDHAAQIAAPQPSPTAQAASSAVLKAIRKANMQLVRTGDNAFMLVQYKVATAQAAGSVPAVSDLPPLPEPDLRDVGTKPQDVKDFLNGYATEYARLALAARAPSGLMCYDGWWHESAGKTWREALEEAKRGACLPQARSKP